MLDVLSCVVYVDLIFTVNDFHNTWIADAKTTRRLHRIYLLMFLVIFLYIIKRADFTSVFKYKYKIV